MNRQFYAVFDPLLYQRDARCLPSATIDWAVEHGMMGTLEKSLRHGAEVPLCAPAANGFPRAPSSYKSPTATSYHFASLPPHPLYLAVQSGLVNIAELFITRGCNVNITTPACFSLLCLAVIHGHACMSKSLLGLGPGQDNNTMFNQQSLVQIAAFRGGYCRITALPQLRFDPPNCQTDARCS